MTRCLVCLGMSTARLSGAGLCLTARAARSLLSSPPAARASAQNNTCGPALVRVPSRLCATCYLPSCCSLTSHARPAYAAQNKPSINVERLTTNLHTRRAFGCCAPARTKTTRRIVVWCGGGGRPQHHTCGATLALRLFAGALTRACQEERLTRRTTDFIVDILWPNSSDLFSPDEEALNEDASASCPPAQSARLSSDLFSPDEEALMEASASCPPARPSCLSSDLLSLHDEASGSCLPTRALLAEPDDAFASLHAAAYLAPQKIAVVHHGSAAVLTYAQLYARALRTAAAFLHLGLDKRGRVAVMLANSVGVLLVHFAAAATRTVVINLNTHLAAPELAFMLRSALPEVLVIDNALVSVLTHTLEESIWGRGSAPCSLRSVLWVGGCPDSASLECLSVLGVSSFDFEDLVSHSKIIAPLTLRDLPPRSLDDTFMVSFTEMAIAALLRVLRARISIFCLRSCISPAVPPAAPRWLS